MKIIDCVQGSVEWWEARRGLPTASSADRILTPKRMQFSAQAEGLIDELIGDLVNQSPNWFSEYANKPPNKAIEDGIAREAEAKKWYAMTYDANLIDVGFCLSDCGRYGCSPDALIDPDGVAEIKCPMHKTQCRYLRDPKELLSDYICQTNFQLIVTGRAYVELVSYAPPLEPLVVRVTPSKFTEALREALAQFLDLFARAKQRLGIPDKVTAEGEVLS